MSGQLWSSVAVVTVVPKRKGGLKLAGIPSDPWTTAGPRTQSNTEYTFARTVRDAGASEGSPYPSPRRETSEKRTLPDPPATLVAAGSAVSSFSDSRPGKRPRVLAGVLRLAGRFQWSA